MVRFCEMAEALLAAGCPAVPVSDVMPAIEEAGLPDWAEEALRWVGGVGERASCSPIGRLPAASWGCLAGPGELPVHVNIAHMLLCIALGATSRVPAATVAHPCA